MEKKYRPALFIITYVRTKKEIEYILLKRKLHWRGWEFPKGKVERGEKKRDTIKRELKEETNLNVKKIKKFNISGRYKYRKELKDRPDYVGQTYQLFAAEVKKPLFRKIKLSEEHSEFRWVSFKEAIKLLTWPNQRKCLQIVDKWLKQE